MPLDSGMVQGPPGPGGPAGSSILWGTIAPGATGRDGDCYVNIATGDLYWKASGAWGQSGNITGPQGPQGLQGTQGVSGASSWDTIVKTAADRATTNASATDVPDLLVALLANSVYEFEAVLRVASSSTAGCKYAVQFSAAGASAYAVYTGATAATTAAVTATNALNTLDATAFVAAAIDALVHIRGLVFTGANAGNFTIQQGKVTNGTATVRANSLLKVRKV